MKSDHFSRVNLEINCNKLRPTVIARGKQLLKSRSSGCGLPRITQDYQYGSPSSLAVYQSFSPLGITADYSNLRGLLRLLELLLITLDYSAFHRITISDHQVVQRITRVILRTTRNYRFGSPSGPTDNQSYFPLE